MKNILCQEIFVEVEVIYSIYENDRKRGKQINVIYKIMTAWPKKCRTLLIFMAKEIKDTK